MLPTKCGRPGGRAIMATDVPSYLKRKDLEESPSIWKDTEIPVTEVTEFHRDHFHLSNRSPSWFGGNSSLSVLVSGILPPAFSHIIKTEL